MRTWVVSLISGTTDLKPNSTYPSVQTVTRATAFAPPDGSTGEQPVIRPTEMDAHGWRTPNAHEG